MSGSRLAVVVLAWVVGAGAVALASGASWAEVPGTQLAPGEAVAGPAAARALGVAALAAAAAVPLLRSAGRRALGGLGVLLGGGAAAVVVASWPGRGDGAVATGVPWAVVALLGALIVAGAAAVTAVRARAWPQPARRFARGAARGVPTDSPAGAREAWEALDRGEDPTERA